MKAARKNPPLLLWILEMAGIEDIFRWLGSYGAFTVDAMKNLLFSSWFTGWLRSQEQWLTKSNPQLWFKLLVFSSNLGHGK